MRPLAAAAIAAVSLALVLVVARDGPGAAGCPGARSEAGRARVVTLFHETHTHGKLAGVQRQSLPRQR
jgi:hypothetical protein